MTLRKSSRRGEKIREGWTHHYTYSRVLSEGWSPYRKRSRKDIVYTICSIFSENLQESFHHSTFIFITFNVF